MDRRTFLLAAGSAAVVAQTPICLAKEQPTGLTLAALRQCAEMLRERHVAGPYVVFVPKDLVSAIKEEAMRLGGNSISVRRMDLVGFPE